MEILAGWRGGERRDTAFGVLVTRLLRITSESVTIQFFFGEIYTKWRP